MILGGVATLLAAIAAAADDGGPDDSGILHRGHYTFGMAFIDSEAGLVAPGGPPPDQGCVGEQFEEAEFTEVATPAGAINALIRDTETFSINEAGSIDEVCEAALTTSIEPIVVAENSKVVVTDNYLNYEPGSRPTRSAAMRMAQHTMLTETPTASTATRNSSSTRMGTSLLSETLSS
jgi:hypothetical protein